jgi:putative transposase
MSYWRLHYHLIWATKQRLPLIASDEEAVIAESLRMTMARMKLFGHAIGMVNDHIHLALSIPPTVAVADAIGRLKGASSHLIGQRLTQQTGFAWQSEYGALSLTERALPTVVAYLHNQTQHHADNSLIHGLERIEQKQPEQPVL